MVDKSNVVKEKVKLSVLRRNFFFLFYLQAVPNALSIGGWQGWLNSDWVEVFKSCWRNLVIG